MPMYSDSTNAENIIKISAKSVSSISFGTESVVDRLTKVATDILNKKGSALIALDGWYGTCTDKLAEAIAAALAKEGVKA